ncbi:hypothetical protein [Sphingomonas faeni]|uniref:hypothetical protein n=1 Tax=Sphingomonas faeni TaxID=185950 RepID=UPI00278B5C2F|nr:hypothetical protein [Sphingomonas faeni]MDQ0837280.1 hypothetical protein [Sphingomonas faeni]
MQRHFLKPVVECPGVVLAGILYGRSPCVSARREPSPIAVDHFVTAPELAAVDGLLILTDPASPSPNQPPETDAMRAGYRELR